MTYEFYLYIGLILSIIAPRLQTKVEDSVIAFLQTVSYISMFVGMYLFFTTESQVVINERFMSSIGIWLFILFLLIAVLINKTNQKMPISHLKQDIAKSFIYLALASFAANILYWLYQVMF